jgi:hypothetical protein
VAGSAGAFLRTLALDADRTLFLIHGISLHAVVYNSVTNEWGGLTLIRSAWGGTGAMDNVVGLLIDVDTVLVASCPENSTALQMVVLTMSGISVAPGAAQTTAAGAASARLLEIIAVGSSFVLGYVTAAGVPRMQARTVSAGVVSAPGTEEAGPSGTAPPALLTGPGTSFAVMTAGGTISFKPYSVSGSGLTPGTPVTAGVTTTMGITARRSDIGRWFITHEASGIKVLAMSFSGAAVVLSTPAAVSSAVTTPTAVQAQSWGVDIQIAVTGTNASGEFITEFVSYSDNGSGAPVQLGSRIPRYSLSTQTVAPAGNNYDGAASTVQAAWTVSTANGNDLHTFQTVTNLGFVMVNSYRIGPSSVANGLPVQATYPKQQLHNSVLSKFASLSFSTLGDGTKAALYSAVGNDLGTMRTSPQLIADPIKGAKTSDQGALWLAYSMGTDARVILEQVRIA